MKKCNNLKVYCKICEGFRSIKFTNRYFCLSCFNDFYHFRKNGSCRWVEDIKILFEKFNVEETYS